MRLIYVIAAFGLLLFGYWLNSPLSPTMVEIEIQIDNQVLPLNIETLRYETTITSQQLEQIAVQAPGIRLIKSPNNHQVFVCGSDITDGNIVAFTCPTIKVIRDGGYPWWIHLLDLLTFKTDRQS